MHLNTNHRHSSHCRRLSIWGSIPNPCRPLSAAWVAHGTCAFLLCYVPTFQPFPYGLRLAEESWQHLGSPRSSCQNALVHAHVASHTTPELAPTKYEYWHKNDDLWLATGVLCSWEMVKFQLRPWKRHRIAICVKSIAACLTHSPEQCSNKKS